MRASKSAAVLLVVYALTSFLPCPAPATVQASPPVIQRIPVVRRLVGSPAENEVVRLVNLERQRRGLRPVSINEKAMADARQWSEVQASRGRMYHSRMGYAENVAYGQRSAEEVVRTWMNSPGHRKNILTPSRSQIGVGLAYSSSGRPYWTQVFN